jgi:hypothetical protein
MFGIALHSCKYSSGVKSYCVFHLVTSVHKLEQFLYLTFSCASYISYSTWSKANTFVIQVTAMLLFCYCKLCVMVLPQCDYLKQLSVSRKSYHSNDYSLGTVHVFPSTCWTCRHDFSFLLSILGIVIQFQ